MKTLLQWQNMGDLANVAQPTGLNAVSLIALIVKAASNARMHKKNCRQFAQHLKLIGNLLEQLKIAELKKYSETREPLEQLEDTLRRSYVLVESCQNRSYLYLLAMGWTIVNQFTEAQAEIDKYLKIIPLINLVDKSRSGSLCRSNDGVFLVDFFSCPISKSEVGELCVAMEKPSICVKDYQDLCIPCRSTVWGSYIPLLNGQAMASLPFDSFFKPLRKGPVLDPRLISKFDIIVSADELDYEYSPLDVNVDNNNNMTMEYRRGIGSHELEELRKHLHLASNIKSVKISKGAQGLIRSYYLALRKAKPFLKKSDDVLSLQSLLRVASACARLCLRDKILEVRFRPCSLDIYSRSKPSSGVELGFEIYWELKLAYFSQWSSI